MTDNTPRMQSSGPQKIARFYAPIMFVVSLAVLPCLLSFLYVGVFFLVASLAPELGRRDNEIILFGLGILVVLCASALLGLLAGKKMPLPDSPVRRYLPILLPCLICAALAVTALLLEDGPYEEAAFSLLAVWALPAFPVLFMFLFSTVNRGLLIGLYAAVYLPFLLALHQAAAKRRPLLFDRRLAALVAAPLVALVLVCGLWHMRQSRLISAEVQAAPGLEHNVDTKLYQPFAQGNRLVLPAKAPSIAITGNYPRLDGAIAVFPTYAALAQALYQGLDAETARAVVDCRNTPQAYARLVDGDVDIFFGAQPSEGQIDLAREQGLTFEMTPIAREAFVFFVNKDNPVESLSVEQIQNIYSRTITNWQEVGGRDASILAFQRNEGSGSQTIMRAKVMRGKAMTKPLEVEYGGGMGGIVRKVADYRNSENALGYSFRWYATVLNPNSGIKLLQINGIAPTPENIRNNSYPFTVPIYAVTCRERSAETEKLLRWLTGPEGQDFIERNGYVAR